MCLYSHIPSFSFIPFTIPFVLYILTLYHWATLPWLATSVEDQYQSNVVDPDSGVTTLDIMVCSLLVHLVLFPYLLTIFFILSYCWRPVGPSGLMASFIRLDTCHLEFLIHLCTLFHFISPFVLHHSSWSLSKSWAFPDHKAMYLGVRNSLLGWIHELFEPLVTTIPSLSPSTITATMTATFSFVFFTDYTVGLT